jgi:hypothetical protein
MDATSQTDRNEIGRRIARHAASYCADRLDFASATLIAHAWGHPYFGTFTTGCPRPACWHNAGA